MKKTKASAGIWVVWIILTILIAGGLVYYYQFSKIPTLNTQIASLEAQITDLSQQLEEVKSDPTADWQTYTNEKYGYSFKYPKDWFLYDKGFYDKASGQYKEAKRVVFVSSKEITEDIPYGSDYPLTNFTINVSNDKLNFDNIKKDQNFKYSDEKIDSKDALKAISIKESDFDQTFGTYYYINHNNQGYVIQWPNEDKTGAHDEIFDQILSTFQFTD